jgi:dihydrofolate synthase/folylpolyglutamate synthase
VSGVQANGAAGPSDGRRAARPQDLSLVGESSVGIAEWERYLDSLAVFGMRPGLERVSALLAVLRHPQAAYRAVHVVGTNGKSSTTRYVAALLHAHGVRAGAYLSPHITGYCERVLVDGRPVARERFGAAVERVREAVAALPLELGETTQFEVLTVAALLALAQEGVGAVALEAGLGGRLDATNIVEAPVVVLTNIGLEHTDVLGDTREAIFAEKAAVIKGGDAVFGRLDGLERLAEQACARAGARALLLGRDFSVSGSPEGFAVTTCRAAYGGITVPTPALYQVENAALAVVAVECLLGELDGERVAAALARTAVPGRLQVVGRAPWLLADGAHNPDGVRVLAASLRALALPPPRVLVCAIMRDKGAREMLATFAELFDAVVCTKASETRSLPAPELAALARDAFPCAAVHSVADPVDAVERARELAGAGGSVVVSGSLYLLEDLGDLLGAAIAERPGDPFP